MGQIRVGVGGWTYEPWRGTFYPKGLPQTRELEFASRAMTTIEINGTYYSTFKPASWRKWRDETPEDFVFSVKASRYATNRKVLAESGPSIEKFLNQGLTQLGPKLGPINWQFMATKKFDRQDFGAFLSLLPKRKDGIALRHAIEVRHPSFTSPEFVALAKRHEIAIVIAGEDDVPTFEEGTAGFVYVRVTSTRPEEKIGLKAAEIRAIAKRAHAWAKRGDAYLYFISGAKERNPLAATTLIKALAKKAN